MPGGSLRLCYPIVPGEYRAMKKYLVCITIIFILSGCAEARHAHFDPRCVDPIHRDLQYYSPEMIDFLAYGECMKKVTGEYNQEKRARSHK